MIQCKLIKDLLKSDYLDGELSKADEQIVKDHLKHCLECKELEKQLRISHQIFQGAQRTTVPGRVWNNIQESIIAEKLKQNEKVPHIIFDKLRGLVPFSRPSVLFAASLSMVLIFAVFYVGIHNKIDLSKQNSTESIMNYSLNSDTDYAMYDLGTNIEAYFL